jgi:hypothetical protein
VNNVRVVYEEYKHCILAARKQIIPEETQKDRQWKGNYQVKVKPSL